MMDSSQHHDVQNYPPSSKSRPDMMEARWTAFRPPDRPQQRKDHSNKSRIILIHFLMEGIIVTYADWPIRVMYNR
jgi:hypothetical protein